MITYDVMMSMHYARNELHSKEWYAARQLPKEWRKVERAMSLMANEMAREMVNEMFNEGAAQ